jgi:Nucleotidyltransferase domain
LAVLPDEVAAACRRYLGWADHLLPGRIVSFYVVGSAALGGFRPGRSDIDFVAVLDRPLGRAELIRLRYIHAVVAGRTSWTSLFQRGSVFSGTCNGVFVHTDDLQRPVSEIHPVASQTGHEFSVGHGFDVNPVGWKVFAEHGVAIRGSAPETLGLSPQPELLGAWNRDNLFSYWQPLAESGMALGHRLDVWFRPRWLTAWGVLGSPRLHHTIATGDVISKEGAGEYALDAFDPQWHPIINEGLSYWRGDPANPTFRDARIRALRTSEFVLEVVRSAGEL